MADLAERAGGGRELLAMARAVVARPVLVDAGPRFVRAMAAVARNLRVSRVREARRIDRRQRLVGAARRITCTDDKNRRADLLIEAL